jgi:hypothetical protein
VFASQRRRLIAMVLLVSLASLQKRQQTRRAIHLMKVVNLLLVMLVNESLYCRNRGVNRAAPKKSG